ncbi:MAG: hydroxyacid dehydrogenase [Pseudomonadota bacterium]
MKTLKRVLLPQPIESEAVGLLQSAGCEIVVSPDPKPETVIPLLARAEGLILRTGIKITRELLVHAEALSIISRTGGGLDNVDVDAATDRGIVVTSNLGVNTSSVVEHALSLMLALSKQLFAMDRAVRNEQFSIRYKNLPRDLREKTLGLLGFGRIGSELGRVCRDIFSMKIIAFDPLLPEEMKTRYREWVEFVGLQALFSRSDVLSIHAPLTEDNRHMVGEREIAWMKPEAIVINTSRGPLIDEKALIRALSGRNISGAGLDVFSKEPVPPDDPLLKLDNVILTPHTAALTQECVIRMAAEAAQCVIDLFSGKRPRNVANEEVLASDRWKHLVPGTG